MCTAELGLAAPPAATTASRPLEWADQVAARIYGQWLPNMSDTRTIVEMIADGVRQGYAAGTGASS